MIYDYLIIGSGPAGVSTAISLTKNYKKSVLILESGLESSSFFHQQLNQGIINFKESGGWYRLDQTRLRMFGGTSNHWSGRISTLRKDEIEDGLNPWPILYADIYKYRQEALKLLKAEPGFFDNTKLYFPEILDTNENLETRIFQWSNRGGQ